MEDNVMMASLVNKWTQKQLETGNNWKRERIDDPSDWVRDPESKWVGWWVVEWVSERASGR